MTNLIILSIALVAGQREAQLTYYTPQPGRIYVVARCAGGAWQSGVANQLATTGTNVIRFAPPCGAGGWFRLRWQPEGAKP